MGKRTDEERAVLENWPVVTGEDIERLNDLFKHYIFFLSRGKGADEVVQTYTTCCGRREEIPAGRRIEQPWDRELLQDCAHGKERFCPWCGRQVTMKDLKKAGKRRMLQERPLALVLHGQGAALYADAIVLWKGYETEEQLTAKPEYWLSSSYRFLLGDVMQVDYQDCEKGYITHEQRGLGRRKLVQEPFKKGSVYWYSHESYHVINHEQLEYHPVFRYCGYFERWTSKYGSDGEKRWLHDFVEYMTAFCMYPRQVEMLVKLGYREPVADLIYRRKKNADAIDWKQTDARKALGLDKRELNWFMAVQPSLSAIAVKKYVAKHWDKRWDIRFCTDFSRLWGLEVDPMHVLSFLRRFDLEPDRFLRYLEKQYEAEETEVAQYSVLFEVYRDYMEASYLLGRCMEHNTIKWPDQLLTAHDEATGALMNQQWTEKMKGIAIGAKERKEKYEFELDGMRIIFPMSGAAIRAEGKALAHCVGGYAERHMKGVLTILFLRSAECPRKSYVTIEMQGNCIKQIHGYANDRGEESPRKAHKKFLDTWLDWLKKGSPRNEDGTPKLPKRKRATDGAA